MEGDIPDEPFARHEFFRCPKCGEWHDDGPMSEDGSYRCLNCASIISLRFANGRWLSGEAYELVDCPLHPTLEGAVRELILRVDCSYVYPFLQTLRCQCEGEDVLHYEAVRSGSVVQLMIAIQKESK